MVSYHNPDECWAQQQKQFGWRIRHRTMKNQWIAGRLLVVNTDCGTACDPEWCHQHSTLCSTGSASDTPSAWGGWAAGQSGPSACASGSGSGRDAAGSACCGNGRRGTGAGLGQGGGPGRAGAGSRGICRCESAPWPSRWIQRLWQRHAISAGSKSWTCLWKAIGELVNASLNYRGGGGNLMILPL